MAKDLRIQDLPEAERPRERLQSEGPEALKTAEHLAILLRTGTKGRSALAVSEELLHHFGNSLKRLAGASIEELCSIPGIGPDKAVSLISAFNLAKRMAKEIQGSAPLMDTPDKAANYLREDLIHYRVETFIVLLLDTRRRLVRAETISQGTLDTLLVHPREVFRKAITHNASALLLAHNHPSGDPTPSEADIRVTRDLIRAGQLLKIEVLDHIILGKQTQDRPRDYCSLRELGYFYS